MKKSALFYHLGFGFFGLALGYFLVRIGFSDFGAVHRMFALSEFRLLFTFAGAVALSMVGFAVFARGHQLPHKPIHNGTIVGGILFGIGWAITGACPSIALVQLGKGHLPAAATVIGILFGAWAYKKVHAQFFRWDTGACNS